MVWECLTEAGWPLVTVYVLRGWAFVLDRQFVDDVEGEALGNEREILVNGVNAVNEGTKSKENLEVTTTV
jgi:hypothetical protein